MAKLLQNHSNLNDLEYSRHLKVRKIEKKAKKKFEGQTKARGQKTQIFHNFLDFLRLIGSKNSCGAIFFHFRSHKGQKGHYKAKSQKVTKESLQGSKFDVIEGVSKVSRLTNCRFTTISSQISAIYINIFHKTEVQTVILRC